MICWLKMFPIQKFSILAMRPLLERIEKGEIDPSFIITHRMRLNDAPEGYKIFRDKQQECVKVILKP